MSESELDHANMDLEQDDARVGAATVADNACCEAEENFAASGVAQGMDIEREEGEKKSAQIEEDGRKAEVSSSGALVVGAAAVAEEGEESPDRPASRPRRSDAARPGLRTKTRSSSLASGKASESRGTRKRGEDGEELRSSSEEVNNNGNNRGGGDGDDEVDGTAYRCGICNEDFESAKSLSFHKKYHPQYTLRRNPKRSRKLIDQEFAVDAAAATGAAGGAAAITATGTSGGAPAPLQAAPTTKKTSSMSEEFPRPCTQCGKEFASWKALFGHMRCHPEREWRGIQPPAEKHTDSAQGSGGAAGGAAASFRRKKPQVPPPPAPSVITFQEDNEKSASLDSKRAAPAQAGKASDNESDTGSFEAAYITNGDHHTVTSWMTGKRSKRSRQTHRSLDAVNNVKKELSASNNVMTESNDMIEALMLLQSADKEKLTIPVTPDSHKTTASRSKSRTPESGLEAEAEELSAKRVKMEPDVASPCNDTEDGADDFDAAEQGSSARSKYECTTCKRQFKSHQALGGHRASHKKVKGCFARTNVSDGAAHEQSVDSMEEPAEDDVKSEDNNDNNDHSLPLHEAETTTSPHHHHHHHSEEESAKPCYLTAARDDNEEMMLSLARKAKAHECSICHRVFTSGQALGGHKRCHWGGGSGIPEAAAASATTAKPMGRMLKEGVTLDLNLPAPECLEEMEEAGMSYSFFEIMHKEQQQSPPPTSGSAAADDQVVVEEQFASSFKPLVTTMALVPGLTPTSA